MDYRLEAISGMGVYADGTTQILLWLWCFDSKTTPSTWIVEASPFSQTEVS